MGRSIQSSIEHKRVANYNKNRKSQKNYPPCLAAMNDQGGYLAAATDEEGEANLSAITLENLIADKTTDTKSDTSSPSSSNLLKLFLIITTNTIHNPVSQQQLLISTPTSIVFLFFLTKRTDHMI